METNTFSQDDPICILLVTGESLVNSPRREFIFFPFLNVSTVEDKEAGKIVVRYKVVVLLEVYNELLRIKRTDEEDLVVV